MIKHIRQATAADAARLAEIEIFNYRMYFYPIFRADEFYFGEMQVPLLMADYLQDAALLQRTFVYDDGAVKGFIRIQGEEIEKLFVEPVLHSKGIGAALLEYALGIQGCRVLWALEKNERAIAFYQRHGFHATGDRKPEEDTTEYLIRMEKK